MLHHRNGRISEQAFDMLQKMAFQHYIGNGQSEFHLYKRFAKPTALPAIEELIDIGMCDIVLDQSADEFLEKSYKVGFINGVFGKLIHWMMGSGSRIRYYQINIDGFKHILSRGRKNLDLEIMYDYASDIVYIDEMKKRVKELG